MESQVSDVEQSKGLSNPLSIEIVSTRNQQPSDSKKKSFTVYTILIKWDEDNSWTVPRRFREFAELHAQLRKKMRDVHPLPSKTWMRDTSEEFTVQRKIDLDKMLKSFIVMPAVVNSMEFRQFMEILRNVPNGDDVSAPDCIETLKDARFGVRDLIYDEEDKVIFSVTEEMSFLSVVDSYITNTRLPWEEEAGQVIPLGALSVWKQTGTEWKLSCTEYSKAPMTAISWNPAKRQLFCGDDDGNIKVLSINEDCNELQEETVLKAHKSRVSCILYLNDRNLLITGSRDKTLQVYDFEKELIIFKDKLTDGSVICMTYDSHNDRLFVGTHDKNIVLVSLSTVDDGALETVVRLEGHEGSVRCLYFDPRESYLFSGSYDSNVCIWAIGPPGKEADRKNSRSIGFLKSGPKLKVKAVVFCPKTRQVVTGLEQGYIVIWTTISGTVQHVIKAHDHSVVKLIWLDSQGILISGSEDKNIKFWRFKNEPKQFLEEAKQQQDDINRETEEFKEMVQRLNEQSERHGVDVEQQEREHGDVHDEDSIQQSEHTEEVVEDDIDDEFDDLQIDDNPEHDRIGSSDHDETENVQKTTEGL